MSTGFETRRVPDGGRSTGLQDLLIKYMPNSVFSQFSFFTFREIFFPLPMCHRGKKSGY